MSITSRIASGWSTLLGLTVLTSVLIGAAPAAAQQAGYPIASGAATQADPPRPHRRLLTFVPRLGVQFGSLAGDLEREAKVSGFRISNTDEATGGFSLVAGGDVLFRLRSGMRIGAGISVMPRVQIDVDPNDSELASENRMLGTLIRAPFIIEWEVPLTERVSLVAGAAPGLVFQARGKQEKRRAEVEKDDPGVGVFLDGEFGALFWIDNMALRADLRAGLEVLSLVAAQDGATEYSETLTGLRMQLLLGVEL